MRILEALCISQGWDVAVKWEVNSKENRLEFCTAWGAPGCRAEALIQESMGLTFSSGKDLPGRAWKDGRPVWLADLSASQLSPRIQSALRQEMVSGWAVPVRVGNKVLAILEFYCHFHLREDREAMAAIETVASSLGQMLARSHERGRAEELSRQQEILLDSVADGICGVDRHGLVSFANPAAARLLCASAADLTGKPVHELLHGSAEPSQKCAEDCPLLRATEHNEAVAGEDIIFRGVPSFAPEILRRVKIGDAMKAKKLREALQQMAEEGVVQVFLPNDGSGAIAGVVGALQLDVLLERLKAEYSLEAGFETTRFELCRWVSAEDPAELDKFVRAYPSSMARDLDDAPVFMAQSAWALRYEQEKWPAIVFSDVKDYQKKAA